MDYRNERDALRGRVESLEQELSEAREELAAARGRETEVAVDGARREAARLEATRLEAKAIILRLQEEKKPDEPGRVPMIMAVLIVALPILGAVLSVAGVVGKIWMRRSEAAATAQPFEKTPADDFPVVDFDRPPTIATWSATWFGRISRARGSAPPPGTTCVVEGALESASASIRLAGLTVTCGGTRLYSISGDFARARASGAIVLKRAVAPSTYVYGLRYDEAGARALPGGSVTIDTTRQLGAVQCDTPTFRVDFALGEWSEPIEGEPLADPPHARGFDGGGP